MLLRSFLAVIVVAMACLGGSRASAAPCPGPYAFCHCHTDDGIIFKCKATPPASGGGTMSWPTASGTGSSGVSGTGTASYLYTSGTSTSVTYTSSGPDCETTTYGWDATNSPHCSVCP